jgi:4-amino-4-deoxy-L-arabinose transferase-like glycosyltransferase
MRIIRSRWRDIHADRRAMSTHVPAQQHAEGLPGPAALPKVWMLLTGLILLWIYGYGISANPLTWEEPRRCLVALEMIYRGDYIVPHVLGEPYRNKPPLLNWLIVLFAGNRANGVGAVPIRLIGLLSLLGISWCLWQLTRGQHTTGPAWLPVLIFLTMGIVIQYGRSGELDPLFTFWVVAALYCFEAGRRRQAAWLQWGLSQAILAGGVLTKGLAPVFFYPPTLYCAWQDRKQMPFTLRPFLMGLALEIVLVSAWLLPYSRRSSAAALGQRWTEELLSRTPAGNNALAFVAHLVYFPFEIIGAMMPWSLVFGFCLLPQVRQSIRSAVRMQPSLRLAVAVSLWSAGLLWLMPGAKGRYFLPGFVSLAVLCGHILVCGYAVVHNPTTLPTRLLSLIRETYIARGTAWLGFGLSWGGLIFLTARVTGLETLWQPLVIGLVAIMSTYCVIRGRRGIWPFGLLILMALLYGIFYVGVNRVLMAEPPVQRVQAAYKIAAAIEEFLPVVCETGVVNRECFVISRSLGRPLQRNHPSHGAYLLVTALQYEAPAHSQLLTQVAPLALWRVSRD